MAAVRDQRLQERDAKTPTSLNIVERQHKCPLQNACAVLERDNGGREAHHDGRIGGNLLCEGAATFPRRAARCDERERGLHKVVGDVDIDHVRAGGVDVGACCSKAERPRSRGIGNADPRELGHVEAMACPHHGGVENEGELPAKEPGLQ